MTTTNFKKLGQEAFKNGESSAPILNKEVQKAIANLPVGGGAKKIFKDFNKGWHTANLQAVVA